MSSSTRKLADLIDEALTELDDKDLASLPSDKIMDIKKKLNPYGRTIEGSDHYLTFSITQISHEYWKKFIITAFVGFLNRMNDEWKVPDGIPVVPVYEYLKDPSKLDTPEITIKKGDKNAMYEYELNRKWMEKRIIVKQFLEEFLQFNPDEHVRSAYRPNPNDKDRKPVKTEAGKLANDHLKATDKEYRAKVETQEAVTQALASTKTKRVKKTVISKDGKKKEVWREVPDVETTKSTSESTPNTSESTTNDVKTESNNTSATNNDSGSAGQLVREMIPPHDTFGRFKHYYTSHYEELRDAVNDLYCEKPELELAINPYSWHDSREDADKFIKKHSNEVIAEIFPAHSGKWNFFDSFKSQRESVNFYNENTAVLEEMIKQLERDEKLAQDMLKKRVTKAKAKNDMEVGPDAESFKKWRSQNTDLQKLGAKHIGDMADDDCPDDAVQVDVWKVNPTTLQMTKEKIFTQAEAPTFVKEAQDAAMAQGKMQKPINYELPQPQPQKSREDNV